MPMKMAWLITRTNPKSSIMANGLPLQILGGEQKETRPRKTGAIKCLRPLKMASTSRFCWKGLDEKTVHAFSSGLWMTPARSPRDWAGKLKIGPSTINGKSVSETSSNQTASLDYRLPPMPMKMAWLITRTNPKSSIMANGLPLQILGGEQKETRPRKTGAIKCLRPLKMASTSRFCWKGLDEKTVHAFSSGLWMTPVRSPRYQVGRDRIGPWAMDGKKLLVIWSSQMEWSERLLLPNQLPLLLPNQLLLLLPNQLPLLLPNQLPSKIKTTTV